MFRQGPHMQTIGHKSAAESQLASQHIDQDASDSVAGCSASKARSDSVRPMTAGAFWRDCRKRHEIARAQFVGAGIDVGTRSCESTAVDP